MIKISHETPKCLLSHSINFNDFQYALPHLLESDEEYRNHFLKCKQNNIEIYLDNSLHELGYSIDDDILFKWIEILEPSTFFVPDVWENTGETLENAKKWIYYKNKFPKTTLTPVIQAKSLKDIVYSYCKYKKYGYDKIAFSYGNSIYEDQFQYSNKSLVKAFGRAKIISYLYNENIIKEKDRIHLLGTANPIEFKILKYFSFIESIDTSNPIMATIDRTLYDDLYEMEKPIANMNNSFDIDIKHIDMGILHDNIRIFRDLLR